MSTDHLSTDNDEQDDRDVLAALQSFGQTLEEEVGEPIRPAAAITTLNHRRTRTVAWLAAAALLVTAGFGLGVVWRDRSASIDSVGEAELEDRRQQDADADETGNSDRDQSGENSESDADESTPPAPELVEPSSVLAVDGSELAVIESEDLALGGSSTDPRSGVVVTAVVDELLRLKAFTNLNRSELAELLATGGLTVETTFDDAVHEAAIAAIDQQYPNVDKLPFEPGLVSIDNRTGAIVAISSRDPAWDGLSSGPRQTGSAFKTFVLAQAYEDGIHPQDSIRADGPCTFGDELGQPLRVGGSYRQRQSVAAVTRSSNNCAFVRLGQIVGTERYVELARRLGINISPDMTDGLDLPLGVAEQSAIDMTGAYATFANGGMFEEPWLVARVTDRDGRTVYEHEHESTQVVTVETADLVTDTLASNVVSGTGRQALLANGHVAAGKTGTTNEFVDAWFVGYSDYYTTGVWLGDIDGTDRIRVPGWNSFGGGLPAAVFGTYMDALHQELTPVPFPDLAADPDRASLFLEVDGELPFCDDLAVREPVELRQIDSDGDGVADCVTPVAVDD